MKIQSKGMKLGMIVMVGLSAGMSHSEVIGFELSGSVESASNFGADSGIWSDIAQGQGWSLAFELNTDNAFGFGTPGVDITYSVFNTAYDFQIGDTSIQEAMFAATVRVQGPSTGNESITIELNGENHLGIPLTWAGDGVSTVDTEIPTGDWMNSLSVPIEPIRFSSFTSGGSNNDLAVLRVDSITITPAPMSLAPLAAGGLVAMRRRRSK